MFVFKRIKLFLLAIIVGLAACTPATSAPTVTATQTAAANLSLQEADTLSSTQTAQARETPLPISRTPASTQTVEDEARPPIITPTHPPTREENDLPAATETAVSPQTPTPTNWKTFVSTQLQVAIDYPPDWSVNEQAAGATFSSPQGAIIQLTLIETEDISPEEYFYENQLPNTRCSSTTNAYGIIVRNCFDTISRSQSAEFILKPPSAPSHLFSLTTRMRGSSEIFQAMIASVRPASP